MHSLSVQLVQYVYGCGNTYWSNRNLPLAINSKNNYCLSHPPLPRSHSQQLATEKHLLWNGWDLETSFSIYEGILADVIFCW